MRHIFDADGIETIEVSNSGLPEPLRTWVSQIAKKPLYREIRANCGDCPLLKKPKVDNAHWFSTGVRCCTYNPRLSNFQVGALFRDPDPSLEIGRAGFGADGRDFDIARLDRAHLEHRLRVPNSQRIFYVKAAFDLGLSTQEVFDLTKIDPWFLENLRQIVEVEKELAGLMT